MNTHRQRWQIELSELITDIDELCKILNLNKDQLVCAPESLKQFPLRVPRQFVDRMQAGNPNDPLLLQVLAQSDEMNVVSGFSKDPLQESAFNPVPGLLHKYQGRVLLILTTRCAINCRYCFRRHFPYEENLINQENWKIILNYLSNDSSIEEVILSGGEPLLVKDNKLKKMMNDLEAISHLQRLRIHTRLPVVIPDRITDEFLKVLKQSRLKNIIVIHSNHANEIDDHVKKAMKKLRENQIDLFNQAVLLKNINDSAESQIYLSKTLFSAGVIPYYLHLLDPVQGTAHFFVEKEKAIEIFKVMQAQLPGYLVPKLVCEKPSASSKQPLL